MLIDYAAITHPGKVRKNNEDAYLLSALDGEEPIINGPARSLKVGGPGLLVAVADGMGGAAAGEVASREGLAAVSLFLFGHWGRLAPSKVREVELLKALETAVEKASDAVLRYSDDDRTARLENINIHLPWFFWWVTLLLMLLLLLEAGRLEANSPLSRAIAGYAAALGLLISLLFAVDTPFRGDTSVSSQPFRVAFLSMQPAPIPAPGGAAAPASDRSVPVPIPSSR